jgi:hypothetical protein
MPRDFDYAVIAENQVLSKTRHIMPALGALAADQGACARVLDLAEAISARLDQINVASPAIDGKRTNPFVLAAHARKSSLRSPIELDRGLAAAKEFSGLETALGRIVEDVVPAFYGWEQVHSEAHSLLTEVDCAKLVGRVVRLAALKSGPACMNDTMVNKIGGAVAENHADWAAHWGVDTIEYTVGMNYSTGRNSNKKDWHAVRLAEEKMRARGGHILVSCVRDMPGHRHVALRGFEVRSGGVTVKMAVRQGVSFWDYVAQPVENAYLELCCALALSAAPEATAFVPESTRTLGLRDVVEVPPGCRVPSGAPIHQLQLPWLFLFVRHFVDVLTA